MERLRRVLVSRGGEAFLVLLYGADYSDAARIAEQLRAYSPARKSTQWGGP